MGVDASEVLGGREALPPGLELPPIVAKTPRLVATVAFAQGVMGLEVESVNSVLARLVEASVLITVEFLVESMLLEKRLVSARGPPGAALSGRNRRDPFVACKNCRPVILQP